MVAPVLSAATVFSTAGGRSERLIFFSWADEVPANNSPLAAIATNRLTFMFPPERGRFAPPLKQSYSPVPKHRINAQGIRRAPLRLRLFQERNVGRDAPAIFHKAIDEAGSQEMVLNAHANLRADDEEQERRQEQPPRRDERASAE